eukprot:TRINITY_DN10267_c0_g1_i1.p3 TRINITY_DN10267_c0_g1~~TRINITY_DN10267_c0_g1_i1.p3  ORF type:complete len:203 (-),score=7.58 TRINITY_DN10267_c0_g1_i1:245-853(-)
MFYSTQQSEESKSELLHIKSQQLHQILTRTTLRTNYKICTQIQWSCGIHPTYCLPFCGHIMKKWSSLIKMLDSWEDQISAMEEWMIRSILLLIRIISMILPLLNSLELITIMQELKISQQSQIISNQLLIQTIKPECPGMILHQKLKEMGLQICPAILFNTEIMPNMILTIKKMWNLTWFQKCQQDLLQIHKEMKNNQILLL